MLLLIGPAVAVIGLVAVFFVMRHKSVEKRSMYSSRRSQIEHKVRAARERTLAGARHSDKGRTSVEPASTSAPALTYEPPAYAGPPVAPPPKKGQSAPAPPAWDTGPTAPAPVPSPPTFAPPPPAYEPPPQQQPAPPQQPPPQQAPYEPAPAAEPWTPIPSTQVPAPQEHATPAPPAPATTSAGGGASWSVVGETKGTTQPEPEPAGKKKKAREDPGAAGAWALASSELAADDAEEGPRKASPVLAIAQYAVLVVGLVMVLIGVVVMVANSHVT